MDSNEKKHEAEGTGATPQEVVEVVEVEVYGKRNEAPPQAKKYQVRIDTQKYIFEKRIMKGRELLEAAGKVPVDSWRLHEKLHGGQMLEIGYDQDVDLGAQGVERFSTYEVTVGDGSEPTPPRRAFSLPEEDQEYLLSLGLPWETIKDGETAWLLLHDHPVPAGYNAGKTTVAVSISRGYPPTALDMVYFKPALARLDGKPIHALADQNIDGLTYQRWSRHYGWRAGEDSLITHHLRIKEWLETELGRG